MRIEPKSLYVVLQAAGWSAIPLSPQMERLGFFGAYECPFAVVGFVSLSSTAEISARWAECQVQMAEHAKSRAAAHPKDGYLVFLVPKIQQEAEAGLSTVLSDTHVCRKLCVETAGRAMEEIIKELPFVITPSSKNQNDAGNVIPLLEALDLPNELKNDLGTKSPQRMLAALLRGKYAKPKAKK